MHEYSVVLALIEQCEAYVSEHQAGKVLALDVKIGVFSGVEPELFARAFETFQEKTVCEGALLRVQIQPLVVECRECSNIGTLDVASYSCPECGSGNIIVLEGEELLLMSLEME